MNEPKFKVGEEVIVQSRHVPMFESVVVEVHKINGIAMSIYTEEELPQTYSYKIAPDISNDGLRWHESTLCKKHKPGDSFESIMNAIRQPIGERV